MITSDELKQIALGLGADKCGIAPVSRFEKAPQGFRPTDIYSVCKSVIVFLKRMLPDAILAEHPIIYSHTAHLMYPAIDRIGFSLCHELEGLGIRSVPVPCDAPYMYWDAERKHGMGILSMRHAAYMAGLGILGRNTLLISRDFGNMVYIGAVLTSSELEADPVADDFSCPEDCSLCLEACPVGALDGITVNQKLCRERSCFDHPRGWDIYMCNECRKGCRFRNGV